MRLAVRQPRYAGLGDTLHSGDAGPEESASRADMTRRLRAAVAALPSELREVAIMMLEGIPPIAGRTTAIAI